MVEFTDRHIGPDARETREMLKELEIPSIETLISRTIPASIRFDRSLDIPEGIGEYQALEELRAKFRDQPIVKPLIGQGYHGTVVPPVIKRNLFENPAWYTSYTPYQPEISQGRLELLFHFQTLVSELTGLPVANSSLLDEATAIAEAAALAHRHHRAKRNRVIVANSLHQQSIDVLSTRLELLDCEIENTTQADENTAAVIVQVPDSLGEIADVSEIVAGAKQAGALVIFACDPLALTLMKSPAEQGADICVGSMQRFGVPMGNGGPHAAYMAVSNQLTRLIPGRLVGQSVDSRGNPAYRLALQTREQHIRREKATSNICTAQALLANMAAAYAIWHGPEGLIEIAEQINANTARFAAALDKAGVKNVNSGFFDTVTIETGNADDIIKRAADSGYLLRKISSNSVSVSFDETVTETDLESLCAVFGTKLPDPVEAPLSDSRRDAGFMTQEVFHQSRSETAMMRFLRVLADKDLALDRAMIPLGSCTMKLNAAAEMIPVSWPEFANAHPFAPAKYLTGYKSMIDDLDKWLSEITGFAKVSFQPNAGSQGEFSGLIAIHRYHKANGDTQRNICLIPESAHGTNPASAQMAGMDVVVVKCDDNGNVDIDDLRAKAEARSDNLAALMITYPSTHGVFEEAIREICDIIHDNGGQVYFDGANLNALVGLARPGDFGADVCHMNLHKTFCIPHGGGGPGVGPIGVAPHLVDFLPGHFATGGTHAVAAAPEGSASILPITWMYIRMMGATGLRKASEIAILSANYLAKKLEPHFPVLYKGRNGNVAHECIIDTRLVKDSADISVEDIAKRLIDFGFHAPTMSWPVAGTLMIEPTESEPKAELDRFVDAMAAIRGEIAQVEEGKLPGDDNPLVNAPHTADDLAADDWTHPYSRALAVDPAGSGLASKFWPPVSRVDNVFGDRNLVCTCPPLSDYAEAG
ncbi:MAG: aminomethyl-transferring glycine dehydrogenase [Rhizobiaceae bacterium]